MVSKPDLQTFTSLFESRWVSNSFGLVLHLRTKKNGFQIFIYAFSLAFTGCPRGVMVKAMDCKIVVNEFELQSGYYVHFRTNTLGNGINPLILSAMG